MPITTIKIKIVLSFQKPVSIFLFRYHFHFMKCLSIDSIAAEDILTAATQFVRELVHYSYLKKRLSGLMG